MSKPLPRLRVLSLLLLACSLATAGCLRSRPRIETADSPVRPFVLGVVAQLQKGDLRGGAETLLGRKLDDAAWDEVPPLLLEARNPGAHQAAEACAHNLAVLQTSLELFQGNEELGGGHLPARLSDLLRMGDMKRLPTCPAAGRDTYSAGYKILSHGEGFRIACSGNAHKDAGLAPGYPALDSRFGPLSATACPPRLLSEPIRLELTEIRRDGERFEVLLTEAAPSQKTTRIVLEASSGGYRLVPPEKKDRTGALGTLVGACLDAGADPPAETPSKETCLLELRHLATALEMYSSDHGGRYPGSLDALVPRYVWRITSCKGRAKASLPVYQVSSDGEQFDLSCPTHPDVRLSTRYPSSAAPASPSVSPDPSSAAAASPAARPARKPGSPGSTP